MTNIGDYALIRCSGLTSLTIGDGVTGIGASAFSGCSGLTSVTIGKSVTSIGDYALIRCSGLTSIVWNAEKSDDFSSNNTPFYYNYSYSSYNFDLRSQITSFTFGDNVASVPACLCEGLSALTSVTIPNSVTTIEEYAFAGCTALASVTFGNNVATIGEDAFNNCPSLADIVWNVKKYGQEESGYYSSPFYSISSQITSFTFGDDVEEIPAYLCNGMSKLTAVL